MNEYVVYSNWVCAELVRQGFVIKRTQPNPRFPQLNCWVFEKTEDFYNAFGKVSQKRK